MKTLALLLTCFTSLSCASSELHLMNGEAIPLTALNGKWVFVNYWASWCEPCLAEIPEMNKFYETHEHDNVIIYGVNYDAVSVEEQKKLTKKYNIHYPVLSEDPATILNLGDIQGVPTTFVFDTHGKLYRTLHGEQTARKLSQLMRN